MRGGGEAKFGLLRWPIFRLSVLVLLTGCLACSATASGKKPYARDRSFQNFVSSLWPLAEERGVKRETFDRAFANVSFDPKVVAKTIKQPEFVQSIWQYIASAVSPERVERGRQKVQAESAWLAKAKKDYGVDEGVIMGIWGLETDFGASIGNDNVIRALASLAFVQFRGDYFRDELLWALVILQEGEIEPRQMLGSWAGAMGQTQFMPSSYLAYAVDFEGAGRRDIWTSAPDAIGSTANFLSAHGWTKDLPWGFEVAASGRFRPDRRRLVEGRALQRLRRARGKAGGRRGFPQVQRGSIVSARRPQGAGLPHHRQFRRHQSLQCLDLLCARGRSAGRCDHRRQGARRPLADGRPASQHGTGPSAASETRADRV